MIFYQCIYIILKIRIENTQSNSQFEMEQNRRFRFPVILVHTNSQSALSEFATDTILLGGLKLPILSVYYSTLTSTLGLQKWLWESCTTICNRITELQKHEVRAQRNERRDSSFFFPLRPKFAQYWRAQ